MSIKKISELDTYSDIQSEDVLPIVDTTNNLTKKVLVSSLIPALFSKNAGAHNSVYRGEDITDLFYDGTLSEQIAAETFDDIFIGDYIIGQNSNRKYLVADINYYLHKGDTECTTPHVLLIPELSMGTTQMNSTSTTEGAYVGSEMYTTNLADYKTIIENDFTTSHILTYREYLASAVTSGYESTSSWTDAYIELMSEQMVHGSNIFHNIMNGTTIPRNYTTSSSQLALFRLDKSKIVAFNDSGSRIAYWLRDVASASYFANVTSAGSAYHGSASSSSGVRPAFLIY